MSKYLFVFDLPIAARLNVQDLVPKVQEKLDRQGMKWIRSERWYVELASLPDDLEPEEILPMAVQALEGLKGMEIQLGNVNGHPDVKRPAAIVLDVDGEFDELTQALAGLVDEVEPPRFVLSKMKPASTKLGHRLRDFIFSGAKLEPTSWTAQEILLLRIDRSGDQTTIAKFPLA